MKRRPTKTMKKRGKKAENIFERFHSLNPKIQTLCSRSTKRTEHGYYLLQKLLQLNSKLWSIAIISFDQYLLFNRLVVYVVRSSFFSISLSFPLFVSALMQWGIFAVFDNGQTFDLTVCHWNVRFSLAIAHRKGLLCIMWKTDGHRIECMRVARYAIAWNE